MTRDQILPPELEDEYRYVMMPTNLTEDRWVSAVEVRPGNRDVVHHVLHAGQRRQRGRPGAVVARLAEDGLTVPVIGDFHYNGHLLLARHPACALALAKYRINPGNVGAKRHDEHFATIVRVAVDNDKPVRIGVNWGSLDQALLTELMDVNARSAEPRKVSSSILSSGAAPEAGKRARRSVEVSCGGVWRRAARRKTMNCMIGSACLDSRVAVPGRPHPPGRRAGTQ